MKRTIITLVMWVMAGAAHGQIFAQRFGELRDPHLVAWYKFDGNAFDSVSGGTNAVWVGTEAYTNGFMGQAASFNGSSFLAANRLVLNHATVSAWVYPSVVHNFTLIGGIQSVRGGISVVAYSSSMQVVGSDFSSTTSTRWIASISGTSVGAWRHIAVTWTNGVVNSIHIDGTSLGVSSSTSYSSEGRYSMMIGARWLATATNTTLQATGAIDDLRVFNRALSSNDVLRVYQGLRPLHD